MMRGADSLGAAHSCHFWRLGSHLPATLRATTTRLNTFLHIAEALAIIRALGADFRAFAADMLMMFRAEQHEMCRCSANLGASHHERKVLLLGVFAAHFQAMPHRTGQANGISVQTFVNTSFHFRADTMHEDFSCWR